MRMTILGLFIFNFTAFAATVDWTRLEMEMDFLKASTPSKSLNTSKELKLQRKAPVTEQGIAELDSAFDSVSTAQATPSRSLKETPIIDDDTDLTDKPAQKLKRIAPTGSINKDIYESLVE